MNKCADCQHWQKHKEYEGMGYCLRWYLFASHRLSDLPKNGVIANAVRNITGEDFGCVLWEQKP